jgi:hypothetical protein
MGAMKRWIGLVLLLGCSSRGGAIDNVDAAVGEVDLAAPLGDRDMAGAGDDLRGPPADLAAAADLLPGTSDELDCYYNWRTRTGCPAPQISESYLSQNCAGTTGVFVVGRYFQHGNQYEADNGWMPHGPYAMTAKLNRNTWNWLTPRMVCITTSADAAYWTGFEMQLKNPDGQTSNKVTVQNRLGGRPPLPSTGSLEPFDPNACYDAGMTMAEAVAKIPVAGSMTTLGMLAIRRRSRPCNKLTGCGAWGPAAPEATVAARLQIAGNVHFALDSTDCGAVGANDYTLTYNYCTATGGARTYSVHVAASCLMLWQTTRTAIAGDGSYTQTDYGGVLRY